MKKIPVLATIREAYVFTFTHLGAIIGLIWVPMILVTVSGFFVFQHFLDAYAEALISGTIADMGVELLGLLCFAILALLLSAMMIVPVVQLALGTRKQGALVHFAFGTVEWRLFRGIVGLVGFLLVPVLVVLLVVSFLEAGGGSLGAARALAAIGGLLLLLVLALVFFIMRFGMLLPAVAASETGPLLPRTWTLSAGNFWRIFLVAVATLLPVRILTVVIELAVEGPQQTMLTLQPSLAMAAAQAHAMAMAMPVESGITFLLAPLWLGLAAGASAAIYKSLNATRILDEIA